MSDRRGRSERSDRPLRVLVSLPGRGRNTNPYLLQLIDALEALPTEVRISYFSWRRAVLGRYDVFHVHWPERLVRGTDGPRTLLRRLRFTAFLARLAVSDVAVVRTMHNLEAHEAGGRVEGMLLDALERRTTLRIRLNPFTPVPAGAAVATIPHGHYRAWFGPVSDDDRDPGRLLFFGLLRSYKGVEELLSVFSTTEDERLSLRLVGSAQVGTLRTTIERAAREDDRISARIEYVPDADLAKEIAAAGVVVLPYAAVHNSGAAILALSLGRRVLMPATDTTTWLQEEVGNEWLVTYAPPLSAAHLVDALRDLPTGRGPAMPDRDWAAIAEQHVEAFRRAVHLRSRHSRRYST